MNDLPVHHIVQEGQGAWIIARIAGISLQRLYDLNQGLEGRYTKTGEVLVIRVGDYTWLRGAMLNRDILLADQPFTEQELTDAGFKFSTGAEPFLHAFYTMKVVTSTTQTKEEIKVLTSDNLIVEDGETLEIWYPINPNEFASVSESIEVKIYKIISNLGLVGIQGNTFFRLI